MTIPFNWYEDFFHGIPLDLWRKAIPLEHTKAEADFLVAALNCPQSAHLLDVPCGNGRLSFELARRGYRVIGVDISEEFIAEARALAIQDQPPATAGGSESVEFLLGDMRWIEGSGVYDGAYCFGNSFGFLEYADMEKFLAGVARALKSGARFVIEDEHGTDGRRRARPPQFASVAVTSVDQRATSAANPKFASQLPLVRLRTSGSKRH